MTAQTLGEVLAGSRPDPDIVAFDREGRATDLGQFRRDVADLSARLKASSCEAALLACADTYWAAVGLAALFMQGVRVALAPASSSGEGAGYRAVNEILVTDIPQREEDGILMLRETHRDDSRGVDEHRSWVHWDVPDAAQCRLELLTSGSTGAPKRIGKSLRQLEREAETIETLLAPRLSAGGPVQATVPHHHLYGLTFSLVWPLLSGRPFSRQAHLFWETVFASETGAAVLVTSPAHLTRLSGFSPLEAARRPGLILSAGAALPAVAVEETRSVFGRAPTEIFGSTETGAIAIRDWDTGATASRSPAAGSPAWSPLPGVKVGANADGRLLVSSPFIDEQPFLGADLIRLEADGRFHALGRVDDICKIEGKRISLAAAAQALRQVPCIADAAVLVVDDGQPRLAAVVVLDPAGDAELKEIGAFRLGQKLRRQLAGTLETAALPKRWRFVAAIPSQAMGKRRQADLLALFDNRPDANDSAIAASVSDMPAIRDSRYEEGGNGTHRLELDLYIDPGLPQLDGHFPGLPIVPGVALVDWAARLARSHLQIGDGVVRALQVKFRRLIQPGKIITLALEHQPAAGKLAFTYRDGDEILASGRMPAVAAAAVTA